jgi:hypothetical protein
MLITHCPSEICETGAPVGAWGLERSVLKNIKLMPTTHCPSEIWETGAPVGACGLEAYLVNAEIKLMLITHCPSEICETGAPVGACGLEVVSECRNQVNADYSLSI